MKRYERLLVASLSILAAFSCGTEDVPEPDPQPQEPVEETSYEIAPSKLVLLDGGWMSTNEFSVISGEQNKKCKAGSGTETSKAVISTSLTDAVAVFPYSKEIEVSGSKIKIAIPSSQTGYSARSLSFCAGKLGSQKVTMEDLCSRLTFSIKQEGLTSMEIKAPENASLSGKACISFNSDGKASVSFEEASNLITLTGNGTGIKPGKYTIVCGIIPASDNEEEGNILTFTGKGSDGKTYSAMVEDCTIGLGNALELGDLEFEEDEVPGSDAEIKKISLVFIDDPNSTTFLWPFLTPTSDQISNSIEEGRGAFVKQKVDLVMPETAGGYTFSIYSARGLAKNSKSSQGFKFGGAAGDYMTIPAVEGMYLVRVKLITGDSGNNGEPDIRAKDGKTVLEGGSSGPLDMLRGDSHIWNIRNAGLSEPNMIVLTKDDIFRAQILELTYSTSQTYDGEEEGGETGPDTPPVDISSDEIPDFSRVGYHYGDKEIPDVPVITTLEAPSDGADATSLIQKAIDNANGPGAILLKAGKYNIAGTINLNRSGIVLRGEGEKTVLYSTAMTQQSSLILMGIESDRQLGPSTEIVDPYTHCGQMYVRVKDPSLFTIGSKAFVYRPATKQWLSDIRMDQIYNCEKQWTTSGYSLYWERTVVSIEGDCLYLDNPVVMGIGGTSSYGIGRVYTGTKERISECGIENMTLDTRYDTTVMEGSDHADEAHCWNAVAVHSAEHSWIRNITSYHFGNSCVVLSTGAKNITVSSCTCLEPVSKVTGGRRYAFNHSSSQLSIIKDCKCDDDRHQFVCGSKLCGPNVFLRCTGTNSRAEAGPHQRWATGVLFDNVKVATGLNLHDRANYGSGHGWTCANSVLYNCEAKQITVQSPWASAQNWCIGCIGIRKVAARNYGDSFGIRPQGVWESPGVHITPESLYEYQLQERHAKGIYLDKLP